MEPLGSPGCLQAMVLHAAVQQNRKGHWLCLSPTPRSLTKVWKDSPKVRSHTQTRWAGLSLSPCSLGTQENMSIFLPRAPQKQT